MPTLYSIPTSGGQYYWVAVLAPKSCHRYLSYLTGWLCATSWETGVAASAFLAGTIIQGLFVLNLPNYVFHNWHGTLLVIGIAIIAITFNTILAKKLPLIESLLVILHLLGVVLVIPLWALSPLRKGGSVFTEYNNGGGWSSTGLSTIVGMLPVFLALTGLDCSVHMAEEIRDSSRNLPISILTGFFINAFLGLFVILTVIFTAGPVDQILQSETGYPFIEMFYNATKSLAATNVMTSIMIVNLTASSVAALATASRQLWSFARNKGVPFSQFLAPTELPKAIPTNALFVSLIMTIVLSMINIGSSPALNAIFSLTCVSLLTSYMITIGCTILWRLRGNPLPTARFTLGRWGLWINIGALCYLIPVFVFSFFPAVVNPTAATMNWGILMYGAIVIFATIYYVIWGRHTYSPPNEQVMQAVIAPDEFYVGSDRSEPEVEQERVEIMDEKQFS